MNLLIFDVFRGFGDILVTSLILGVPWLVMACNWMYQWLVIGLSMACQWLVIGLPCAGVVLIVNWNMSPAMIGSNNAATGTNIWTTMRRGGAYCILNIGLFSGVFSYF